MNITHPDAGRLPGALGGRGAARSQGASPVLVVSRGKKNVWEMGRWWENRWENGDLMLI